MANTRLIVLDDLFFSRHSRSCPGSSATAPAPRCSFPGSRSQLAAARTANEKVWIMAHLPSGVDAFSTLRGGACKAAPSMLLSSAGPSQGQTRWQTQSPTTADVIQLAIFAHTHEDEIKLIEEQPSPAAIPVKLVPSISPINGNLASITVAEIDPATATLIDYKVIAGNQTVPWKQQYDYAELRRKVVLWCRGKRPDHEVCRGFACPTTASKTTSTTSLPAGGLPCSPWRGLPTSAP